MQLGSLLHLRLVNGDEPLASAPLQEVEAVVDLDTPEPCLKTRSPLETRQSGEDLGENLLRQILRIRLRACQITTVPQHSILVALDEDLERSEIVTGGASCRLDLVDESRVVYRRFL